MGIAVYSELQATSICDACASRASWGLTPDTSGPSAKSEAVHAETDGMLNGYFFQKKCVFGVK